MRSYGTFATGGGDGVVSIWDGKFKKRIHQCKGYPTSIAALAFNGGGTQVAIASSYTFEEGDKPYVRRVLCSFIAFVSCVPYWVCVTLYFWIAVLSSARNYCDVGLKHFAVVIEFVNTLTDKRIRHEPDAIYIRAVKDTEVQPRPSKAK